MQRFEPRAPLALGARRARFPFRIVQQGLVPAGLFAALVLGGCPDPEKPKMAPAGMAGATGTAPAAQPTAQPVAASSQPAAAMPAAKATGAASSQPAAMHSAMAAGAPSSQPAGMAAGAPGAAKVIKGSGPPPAASHATYTGKVEETMNSAGYTYVRVKTSQGNDIWAAVTETKLTVGQQVSMTESLTMSDFHSKTLNRTFASIVFATLN